jgi:endonuclease III
MFYTRGVQDAFAFATSDLAVWRDRLFATTPVSLPATRCTPIGQLVKSLISARTRDAVSLSAYRRLGARYGCAATISKAAPEAVAGVIHNVTFAEAKADHLVAALRRIADEDGGFALSHLGDRPLEDALAWLERLPGVARKVSASTLNASILGRPVFIVASPRPCRIGRAMISWAYISR